MDDLELIKQRLNIVDIVQEYLPLKKTGANFKANCPFHNEKTPSFVVSPERGIWHCFGCFPPGELVKTPFGYHKIEEINKNHWVISGKGELRRVTDTMVHQYEGRLVNITLKKLGSPVKLTTDHHVFAVRGAPYLHRHYKNFSRRYGKYLKVKAVDEKKYHLLTNKYLPIQKIPAGELKKGDLLLYPIRRLEKDVQEINLTDYLTHRTNSHPAPQAIPLKLKVGEELLKLAGYYIVKGSSHRAGLRFSLGSRQEGFAEVIIGLIKRIFGLEAKIYKSPDLLEVTVYHSLLANIFENLCGQRTGNKHIPFLLQDLPISKQRVLMEAILKVGGHSSGVNKGITVTSNILAEQLIDILLRLNVFPSLSIRKQHLAESLLKHGQTYSVFWSETASPKYNLIYYHPDGSQYWVLPIAGLTLESYTGPVYNFTVASDHSYVTNSFAVANCSKGGDVFKFVMEKEGIDFKEALDLLAQKAGVTLKKTGKKSDTTERLLEIQARAQQLFHYLLTEHKLGKMALDYLHQRGVSDETVETFGLGYAPKSWRFLTKFLKKRGFSEQEIITSGLAVPTQKGCYDRFRGRVTFPLADPRGRVVGFSGRILDDSVPKYVNTSQTPIFDKGRLLFGLHLAKPAIRETKSVILVEGEMDMIMSYQSGVKNIVASKGTALTVHQVDLLHKYTDTLNLCFDTDLAGDYAARRGIEIAEREGLNIKVINVEGGKDPGEICQKAPQVWRQAVDGAIPIYDYYLSSVERRFDIKSSFGKRGVFIELLPIWRKIYDPLTKEHYIQKLAALLQVKEEVVRKELNKPQVFSYQVQNQPSRPAVVPASPGDLVEVKDRRFQLEEYLISLMLHIPINCEYVPDFPETLFTREDLKQVYVLLVLFLDGIAFRGKSFRIAEFVKAVPPELVSLVDELYLKQIDDKLMEDKLWKREVDFVITALKRMLIKSSLEKLSLEIKNAQNFDRIEKLETLNKRFRDLSVKLRNL